MPRGVLRAFVWAKQQGLIPSEPQAFAVEDR